MIIDPKFVELTADVFEIFYKKQREPKTIETQHALCH